MSPRDEETFQAEVVDYLDGALDGQARTEFEASLRAHPAWAAEVEALGRTWQRSRDILRAATVSPPARVRAHVLAAAEKQAAAWREAGPAAQRTSGGAWALGLRLRRWFGGRSLWAPALVAATAIGVYAFTQPSLERTSVRAVLEDEAPRQEEEASARHEAPPLPAAPVPSEKGHDAPAAAPAQLPVAGSRGAPAAPAPPPAVRKKASPAPRASARGILGFAPSAKSLEESAAPVAAPSGYAAAPARADEAQAVQPRVRPGYAAAPARAHEAQAEEAEGQATRAAVARHDPLASLGRAQLLERARTAEEEGRFVRAAESYRALLRRFPEDAEAPVWRRALADAEARAAR